MRKTLVFVVVAILLSTVVLSINSEDFTQSFDYKENGITSVISDIWFSILNFFKGGITGFVGYSNGTSVNLTIWDDSDFGVKYVDENITFFANFTNGTGPMTPSTFTHVSISINLPEAIPPGGSMSYNSSSQLWEFTVPNFNYYGNFSWVVSAESSLEDIGANDFVVVNETCLNITSIAGIYDILQNRTLCSGVHNSNSPQIRFASVSGITLNCNNSVILDAFGPGSSTLFDISDSSNIIIKNCNFDGFGNILYSSISSQGIFLDSWKANNSGRASSDPIITLYGSSEINITNCEFKNSHYTPIIMNSITSGNITNSLFFNSSGEDIHIEASAFINISNITVNLNNNSGGGGVSINVDSNDLVKIKNLKFYNAHGLATGVLFGGTYGSSNSIIDSVFENNSNNESFGMISLGVTLQRDFYASNLTFKNVNNSIVDVETSNSNYTNNEFRNCSVGLLLISTPSTSMNFQNSRFYGCGGISSSGVSFSNFNTQNLRFYDSPFAFGLANSTWINVTAKNITGSNLTYVVVAINSSMMLKDLVLDVGSPVNLSQNSTVTFLNVSFNKTAENLITDSSIFRVLWYFNVRVRDIFDVFIGNANVTLSNESGMFLSELTNSSGNLRYWQNLTDYSESAAGKNNIEYNLTVDASGYSLYNSLLQIQNNTLYDVVVSANGSIIVYSPVNNVYYRNRTINLTYRILFNNTDQCWYINSTGVRVNLPGCANTTLTAKEGDNNITVFANTTDSRNFTYSQVFFYTDTVFPNITRFNTSLITNISVLVNWTTSEETNMSLKYFKADGSSISSASNSSFANKSSFTISGLSERTSYGINVTFCDRAGNCILRTDTFQSGSGNYSPSDLHIPEADIIVQELVASELTANSQRSTLTPGSRYIYTIDSERHEVKLKYVYMEERAVFEFSSDPVIKEIPKGGTSEIDLDNDGINDIAITVNNIEMTRVSFDLKRISFKKQEVVPAEGTPAEEIPATVEAPVSINGTGKPKEKTFFEKYSWYMIISLSVIVVIVVAGGAVLMKRKMPVVIEIEQKKKLLAPKTSHLESLMKNVYAMLKDNKTELDVQKYLEELNFEDNVIKSIVFEMKTNNNKIDQMISFAKKQFEKEKSVEEVREILENAGWAKNIVRLATEE